MNIPKSAMIPQCVAVVAVLAAIESGREFSIYALPVSDSLTASMGWYMSFSGIEFGNNGGDMFLCNSKNNVRVFKSLDSLFKVSQDNFIGVITVCCV
jgi:hypothetical protein